MYKQVKSAAAAAGYRMSNGNLVLADEKELRDYFFFSGKNPMQEIAKFAFVRANGPASQSAPDVPKAVPETPAEMVKAAPEVVPAAAPSVSETADVSETPEDTTEDTAEETHEDNSTEPT